MLRRPAPYIRGLALAFRYGNWHPMKTAYALVYFTEALIAGRMLERRGHTHFHLHYTSTVGMMLSTVFPITLSMTIHGSAEFIEPAAFYLREKIQASKFVCAISYYGKSQLMLHSPASEWPKFYVTPLGIDIDLYRPAVFREHPQPFEVICVGRLCTGKGYELLIESIADLAAQGRDVRLRLVGDGPERKSLQVLAQELSAEDRIVFEGSRNQNEVRSLYAQADAFALASFAEGVPVVLIEAMAMGLPCVATRITGIPELIRDGVDGLLVTPAIRSELTEALSRLMDNPELRRQMGENARERIRERHEIQKCVRSLAAVFERELPARESVPALNGTAQGTA
jgi:glycosyltransferase involved in cell wall biosynthesis